MAPPRDNRRAPAQTIPNPSRRAMLAGATAALAAGAAIASAAHGAPTAPPAAAADDAELIALCAAFDDCDRQIDTVYATEPDDELAESAAGLIIQRQAALAERIMGSRVHTPEGIVAIARSLAVSNGNGEHDFHPSAEYTTGRLMTALMREVCLLSGLPAPARLTGRTAA